MSGPALIYNRAMKILLLAAAVLCAASAVRADVLECDVAYKDKNDGQWRQPRQIYGVTCEPGRSPRFQSSASYPFHVDLRGGRTPDGRRTFVNEGYMIPLSRAIALASRRFSYEGGKLSSVELSLGFVDSICETRDRVVAALSVKVPLTEKSFEFAGDVGSKEGGEQPVRLSCRTVPSN
jgi:hypothetical protein